MKSVKYILVIFILINLFGRCTSDEEQKKIVSTPVIKEQLPAPFHFNKAIEIRPGLTLDVLSWGRGSDSTGAYLILRSDSIHKKFSSTTGELKGNIMDVWDMDMDSDGNPEIYIQAKDKKSNLILYVYEYDGSGASQKLHFPDLSDATKAKYRGKDSLYVKDGKLIREFPLFKKDDPDDKPSEGKKVLIYSLNKNDFSVTDPNAKITEPEKPKTVTKKNKKSSRRRR